MWIACRSIVLLACVAAIPPDLGDLGAAYLRFERAVAHANLDSDQRRSVNQAFDALTGDFFAGRFGFALSKLAEIEGDLAREPMHDPARAERAFLAAHRFTVAPRISQSPVRDGMAQQFVIRAEALDEMQSGDAPTHVVIRQGDREAAFAAAEMTGTGCTVSIDPPFAAGPVEVLIRLKALGDVPVGRAFVFDDDPNVLRDQCKASIDALAQDDSVDRSTIASLKARMELVFGDFNRGNSAHLLANPCAIAKDLVREIATAQAKGRPYAHSGDSWRVVRVLGTELPIRQYVPEGDGPFPLVIAFHGAGGDENLFFDGYGGGRLLQLAKDRRIAVVCPPTIPFGVSPNVLPKFLEELQRDVRFDANRVGLLGHSLGAATASRLAVLRPDLTSGVVCIAGFADAARSLKNPAPSAPRRVYLAEFDPLFPLEQTRGSITKAVAAGHDIEVVVVPDEGHTLVVGEVLAQAMDWLLARQPRTSAIKPPTTSAPSTAPMNVPTNLPASGPVPADAASEVKPNAGPMK